MGTMPGQGSLPPHVVAKMIRDAKAMGKCAAVSSMGYVCTKEAEHQGVHVAVNALGQTSDSWVEAIDPWTADDISLTAKMQEKAARGDNLFEAFTRMVRDMEADHRDFLDVWERMYVLVSNMPNFDRDTAMELLSYFIMRSVWSNPDTIPKAGL